MYQYTMQRTHDRSKQGEMLTGYHIVLPCEGADGGGDEEGKQEGARGDELHCKCAVSSCDHQVLLIFRDDVNPAGFESLKFLSGEGLTIYLPGRQRRRTWSGKRSVQPLSTEH